MDPEIVQNLFKFFEDKELNIVKKSERSFILESEIFDCFRITTFLRFSNNIEAIVDFIDKRFQGLSQKTVKRFALNEEYRYVESGAFCFEIGERTVQGILGELARKTFRLVEILKSDEVDRVIKECKVKIKHFRSGNCFYVLTKDIYKEIYNVCDCIWLGNIQIFISLDYNYDSINVRCLIENEKTKRLKEIIDGNVDFRYDNFYSLIQELRFGFHNYFLVKKDIYEFFADQVQEWKDFYFKYARNMTNSKVFAVSLDQSNKNEYEIEIKFEKSEVASELLLFVRNSTMFRSRKLVNKQD